MTDLAGLLLGEFGMRRVSVGTAAAAAALAALAAPRDAAEGPPPGHLREALAQVVQLALELPRRGRREGGGERALERIQP